MTTPGHVVIVNGVPRSGKSSIARALQAQAPEPWLCLGYDAMIEAATPQALRPGLGLRPGGERPDLEPFVAASIRALYAGIAAMARSGSHVVADTSHHDAYATLNAPWRAGLAQLTGLRVLLVGLRCPMGEILRRRAQSGAGYAKATPEAPVPAPVQLWQQSIHEGWVYDLEIDTSQTAPAGAAAQILDRLGAEPPPHALRDMLRTAPE